MAACSSESTAGDGGAKADVVVTDAPRSDTSPTPDVTAPFDAAPFDAAPMDAPVDAVTPKDAPRDAASVDAPADGPPPADGATGLTGTVRDVRHVVIFMQENRAFDDYFGALSGVRGFGDSAAMMLRTGASVFHQPSAMGEVLPFHTTLDCVNDVDHGWSSGHDAWHGGLWDRWIPAKGTTAMSSHNRAELAYYYALADAYRG